ncbi:MAG: hypothetical protein CL811_03455 [Colwelliaceae bacterium]|nr:hypothetical protein [Colwelliaceae bacterium]|tara:strand:+ start:551 stop:988 length:438 start_codon:yes stop_codon:yes gene_type:complete
MKKWLVTALLTLGVMGCSSTQYLSDTERNELYQDYISKNDLKKRSFASHIGLDSWSPLTDEYLLMTGDHRKQYLVKLPSACRTGDASKIKLNRGIVYLYDGANSRCPVLALYEITKDQAKDISALGRLNEDSVEEKMLNSAEKPS